MSIKGQLKKMLFGLSIPQQYLCLEGELESPLKSGVTLRNNPSIIYIDHVFVAYKPLVFAFHDVQGILDESEILAHFHSGQFELNSTWRNFPADKKAVAGICLSRITTNFKNAAKLKLYQGEFGRHFFLSGIHQRLNKMRERFKASKPENVNLPGNLHDMVRISYSLPRTIALVTVQCEEVMNLFPTDLHGKISGSLYLSSLRIGGKAQQQVESVRRVVISEVSSDSFRRAYSLGKNHMKEMIARDNFDLLPSTSEKFAFALPAHTLQYYELEVMETVDIGIHRLFLYKIVNQVSVNPGHVLAHIHQYYAQWRMDHGLKTNYLLR